MTVLWSCSWLLNNSHNYRVLTQVQELNPQAVRVFFFGPILLWTLQSIILFWFGWKLLFSYNVYLPSPPPPPSYFIDYFQCKSWKLLIFTETTMCSIWRLSCIRLGKVDDDVTADMVLQILCALSLFHVCLSANLSVLLEADRVSPLASKHLLILFIFNKEWAYSFACFS